MASVYTYQRTSSTSDVLWMPDLTDVFCRAREKRVREAAEARRIKELKKKAQEDAEEERRQQVC